MKKNIIETEDTIMNPVDIVNDSNEEKEFVNPAFPREIYDRAIKAKEQLDRMFVTGDDTLYAYQDLKKLDETMHEDIVDMVENCPVDARIAASCGEFTYNFGHGWEFKMPSTRDIMAKLQKADENPDLRYMIRFSQTVSHHKDQFGTMTEKLVRYFYIRKFSKEDK